MKKTKISRFLSLVLKHRPETIELTLDSEGWVDVGTLLKQLKAHGKPVSLDRLYEVVEANDKKRFEFDVKGTRIRACRGNSLEIDLRLEQMAPPSVLWHGTASRFIPNIRKEGLTPQSRQHVHLSADPAIAAKAGARHGNPVVIEVYARGMADAEEGYLFYRSANGVWLTAEVPMNYMEV
ncbi:MAG: RNA--NAD 2'-phosphotransferase [Verrucomicrobiaceae bacterium]|nr:RNA--NAD 2'-phosphotransferase [Verrucomicrobiaceae bacterium]